MKVKEAIEILKNTNPEADMYGSDDRMIDKINYSQMTEEVPLEKDMFDDENVNVTRVILE